jgi:hypothetical protein
MIPGVPEYAAPFFWPSLLGAGTDSSREKSSPRPVTAGVRHPSSKTARPLNSRPSGRDDIAASGIASPREDAMPHAGESPASLVGLAPASSADSKPARARVGTSEARAAFRWACRTQDRTEARVLDAGEGA